VPSPVNLFRSTSNQMYVRMKADGSQPAKGFKANYTWVRIDKETITVSTTEAFISFSFVRLAAPASSQRVLAFSSLPTTRILGRREESATG
jgi:hypothetical protein